MTEAEDIRRRLAHALEASAGEEPERPETLVAAYNRVVDAVNGRLARCTAWLRRGLLTEALYEAELPPPVLEEAATLEGPERRAWAERCREVGLGPLRRLDRDAAHEINRAYVTEQILRKPLRAHRRLALGHGPLRHRIDVVRTLLHGDPDNPAWREDLATLERARHKEIDRASSAAAADRDVATLEALHREVTASPWAEPPSKTLRETVADRLAEARSAAARDQLPAVAEAIQAAHDAGDFRRAGALLGQWDELRHHVRDAAEVDPQRAATVEAVRQWADQAQAEDDQRRAFDQAREAFERALEEENIGDLDRRWTHLTRFERPMPTMLRRRYASRRAEADLERSRRFRLTLVGAVGGLCLLGGLVGFLVYSQMRYQLVQDWKGQIQSAIDDGDWRSADALLEELAKKHPDIRRRPGIRRLRDRVDEGLAKQKRRRKRFQELLAQARDAGVKHPARKALKRAEALAATEKQKMAVAKLRDRIRQAERAAQKKRDKAFTSALADLRSRFERLQKRHERTDEDLTEPLERLSADLRDLLETEGVSDPLRGPAEALHASVRTLLEKERAARRRRRAVAKALKAVRTAADDPSTLAKRLRAFAKKYPDHRHASDFRAAAAAANAWKAIAAFNETFPSRPLQGIETKADATAALKKVEKYLKAHPSSPYRPPLETYRGYLRRAETALAPANAPTHADGRVQRLLSHPLMDGLYVLVDRNGRRYYLREDEAPKDVGGGTVAVECITKAEQASGEKEPSRKLVPKKRLESLDPRPAPQSRFVEKAMAELEKDRAWETRHLHLCRLAMEVEHMHPVVRLTTLRELLAVALQRDWLDRQSLVDWLDRARAVSRDVDWMDPSDERAQKATRAAEKLLKKLPSFSKLIEEVMRRREELARKLRPRPPVGLLWRADDGLTLVPSDASGRGTLHAVDPTADPTTFTRVGRLRDGGVAWSDAAADQPTGTLVFLGAKSPVPSAEARR